MDCGCIEMNSIVIGLNWTVSLKYLEMTFVGICPFMNKTELNCDPDLKKQEQTIKVSSLQAI